MVHFKSWQSYSRFAQAVTSKCRYVRDSETEEFLAAVAQTCTPRELAVSAGRRWARAQLGNRWRPIEQDGDIIDEVPFPYAPERMKPLENRATEGRANPKGIPYLYLANTIDGAIAEVRPWIESHVTVGIFATVRDLRLLSCVCDHKFSDLHIDLFEEPDADTRSKAVWLSIDQAFSRPVTPNDQVADYVPTQILAELFRTLRFDGIVYRSAFGLGFSIVLFDLAAAELQGAKLFKVTGVKFEKQDTREMYSVSDLRSNVGAPAAKTGQRTRARAARRSPPRAQRRR